MGVSLGVFLPTITTKASKYKGSRGKYDADKRHHMQAGSSTRRTGFFVCYTLITFTVIVCTFHPLVLKCAQSDGKSWRSFAAMALLGTKMHQESLSTPPDCTRLRIETGKSGRIAFKRFCPSRASAWSCERDVALSRICVTDCVLPRMTKLDFGTAL